MAEERLQRRLAAILVADVVGYSRLMGEDEEGTLARIKALRAELFDPTTEKNGGRVVKTTGDGALVEFPSAVDAVRSAIEIQRALTQQAGTEPIHLRIGINVGDVIVDADDIYGDGVNIAARLEGLAKPGGVVISGTVHDQIRGKLDMPFRDLGEQSLRNITEPVRAMEVMLEDPTAWSGPGTPTDHALQRPAIAVLPFANMSGDPEQEYFADGLTDDIITALTYWRSFPVIARNSCFAYKDKAIDITQAAQDLGARYILEGSVRKSGARVRITAQLIDGANGHHVWAEKYDQDLDDIFQLQDEIVQQITAVVAPELDKAELGRSNDKRSENLDAWDLCLRAKPLLRQKTREGDAGARDLFLRAIDIRQEHADAHAGLAQSYNQDILMGVAEDRTVTATQAMEAALNAIKHDEASSWAHHELSTAYQWLNRLDDALDEARAAVELNPNDAYALHALGNKSDLAGDSNGLGYMERAQKLNPEDAQRHTHLTFLARAYVAVGDYDAAVQCARQAIRRRPDYVAAHYVMGIALGQLERLQEARASLEKCDELSPGFVEARRDWQPYADKAQNDRLNEGLRKAGLPE